MEINNTGSTYGAAFRQKPIFSCLERKQWHFLKEN